MCYSLTLHTAGESGPQDTPAEQHVEAVKFRILGAVIPLHHPDSDVELLAPDTSAGHSFRLLEIGANQAEGVTVENHVRGRDFGGHGLEGDDSRAQWQRGDVLERSRSGGI